MTPHQGPVISVVTVVYNGGTVLEATIRSVLEQEYPAIEYIIVDGGSSDNTKVVLQKYSDRNTQWVSEPDNGIYDAMNKAVRMVSGEWVIFMNAGDTFYSRDTLSALFSEVSTDAYAPYGVLYGDRCNIYHDRQKIIPASDIESIEKHMPFCHQAALTRTELLTNMPFDTRYRLGADYDFFLKTYHKGILFKKIDACIANYEAEQGVSSVLLRQAVKESLQLRFNRNPLHWIPRYLLFHLRYTISKTLQIIGLKRIKS